MKPGDKLYFRYSYLDRPGITLIVKSIGRKWVRFEGTRAWKMDVETRRVEDSAGLPAGYCHESEQAYHDEAAVGRLRMRFRQLVMESRLTDIDAVKRAAEALGMDLDA